MTRMSSDVTEILVEALPYIRRFAGKIVVVKFGGNAIAPGEVDQSLRLFAEDVVLMHSVGLRPVVVHGGGPQIDEMLGRLGIERSFVDGVRVTDDRTMDVVRMVLKGQINPGLVAAINVHGSLAVGVSGEDAGFIRAEPLGTATGRTGRITRISPGFIEDLLDDGLIPVIASIGVDEAGRAFNINADTVAAAVAGALEAEKIVFLTDVEGLRTDPDDSSTKVNRVDQEALVEMIRSGSITGGMIPKATACLDSLAAGAVSAHILDGRIPHVLLLELFTDEGVGTMITSAR